MSAWVVRRDAPRARPTAIVATDVDLRDFAFEEQGRARSSTRWSSCWWSPHLQSGEFFRFDQKIDMKLLPATRERLGKTWFPVLREFELAPGAYQAKIVVRDGNNQRIGTVMHEFNVPDLTRLRTSSIVLKRHACSRTRPASARAPRWWCGGRSLPDATLYAQFEVYGAAKEKGSGMPKVVAGYQIRRQDGTVLTKVAPTQILPTSLGKLSRLVGTGLGDAAPGAYEFVLELRDEIGGGSVEIHEPFTVDAAAAGAGVAAPGQSPRRAEGEAAGAGTAGAAGADAAGTEAAGCEPAGAAGTEIGRAACPALSSTEDECGRSIESARHVTMNTAARMVVALESTLAGPARAEGGLGSAAAERAGQVLVLALLEQHDADQEQAGDDVHCDPRGEYATVMGAFL